MNELAIIIPAYKDKFLEKTLLSFTAQTRKDFTIYIGDDHSPFDLKSICDKFKSQLTIKYTRFENNIGAKELVLQWNRCVALTNIETWIWLFSDDDIAEPTCVETFYNTIKSDKSKYDVYRFNTTIINDKDEVINETPLSPFIDSSENMAYEILMDRRGNCMPDHIFSRSVYLKNFGFVYTDYAQSADWATSILFSKAGGICTIQNAKIRWRLGNSNISGLASKNKHEMIKGYFMFLNWALNHFKYLKPDTNYYNKIMLALEYNLKSVVKNHYKTLDITDFSLVLAFCKKYKKNSFIKGLLMTSNIYYELNYKYRIKPIAIIKLPLKLFSKLFIKELH